MSLDYYDSSAGGPNDVTVLAYAEQDQDPYDDGQQQDPYNEDADQVQPYAENVVHPLSEIPTEEDRGDGGPPFNPVAALVVVLLICCCVCGVGGGVVYVFFWDTTKGKDDSETRTGRRSRNSKNKALVPAKESPKDPGSAAPGSPGFEPKPSNGSGPAAPGSPGSPNGAGSTVAAGSPNGAGSTVVAGSPNGAGSTAGSPNGAGSTAHNEQEEEESEPTTPPTAPGSPATTVTVSTSGSQPSPIAYCQGLIECCATSPSGSTPERMENLFSIPRIFGEHCRNPKTKAYFAELRKGEKDEEEITKSDPAMKSAVDEFRKDAKGYQERIEKDSADSLAKFLKEMGEKEAERKKKCDEKLKTPLTPEEKKDALQMMDEALNGKFSKNDLSDPKKAIYSNGLCMTIILNAIDHKETVKNEGDIAKFHQQNANVEFVFGKLKGRLKKKPKEGGGSEFHTHFARREAEFMKPLFEYQTKECGMPGPQSKKKALEALKELEAGKKGEEGKKAPILKGEDADKIVISDTEDD